MTSELPKRTHLVHKPVEPSNLGKALAERLDIHDDTEYTWQLKYDGCHMIVVLRGGKGTAYSREGKEVKSCQHIVEELEQSGVQNYVFFGEAYDPFKTHAKGSGDFRRHSPSPNLLYFVFDGVPLADFEAGKCECRYKTRMDFITALVRTKEFIYSCLPHMFRPSELPTADKLLKVLRLGGVWSLDGYVAKQLDGWWVAGAGKGGEQIKVKDHLSLDLRCVGVTEGKGKFAGMVGSLRCEYNGEIIDVGGGTLTTEERQRYWNNPDDVSPVVEVHALAGSEHGVLREPRFHRMRPDKE